MEKKRSNEIVNILYNANDVILELKYRKESPTRGEFDLLNELLDNIERILLDDVIQGVSINNSIIIHLTYKKLRTFLDLIFDDKEHAGVIDLNEKGFEKTIVYKGDHTEVDIKLEDDYEIIWHTHPVISSKKEFYAIVSPPSDADIHSAINIHLRGKVQADLIFTIEGIYSFTINDELALNNFPGNSYKEKKKNKILETKRILKDVEEEMKLEDIISEYGYKFIYSEYKKVNEELLASLAPKDKNYLNDNEILKNSILSTQTDKIYKIQNDFGNKISGMINKFLEENKINVVVCNYKHWKDVKKDGLEIKNVFPIVPYTYVHTYLRTKDSEPEGYKFYTQG